MEILQIIVGVSANCTDTIVQTVNTSNVIANFNYTLNCNSNLISLTDSSIANGSVITSWNWDFGDGNTSVSQNPNYLYLNPGSYNVQLIVTSEYCSDTILQQISLQYLDAQFSYIYNCQNYTTSFTDNSTYSGIAPNNWLWNFGDGNTSTLQNPVHVYSDTGTYQVQLIISNSSICVDTISTNISIYNVSANFIANNTCLYDSVKFTDITNFPFGTITSWTWNFGDGNTSNAQNPSHLYNIPKNYDVSLIIQTSQGCIDTIIKQITVYPSPLAQFNISTTEFEVNKPIYFVDASTGASSWLWNFGDNFGTSTNQNPTYTYIYPGNYIIIEIVRNEFGCKDTAIQTIYVKKSDEIYPPALPTAFTPNNDNNNDTLFVRGGPFKELLFKVYNEWGQMIFESNDASIGWDGTYKGNPQPIGVYICTVEAITINNKQYKFSQEVTLIR